MRYSTDVLGKCLISIFLFATASDLWAQHVMELEPNNSCSSPQNLGLIELPYIVDGVLEGSEGDGEIDFLRFESEPARVLAVDMKGQSAYAGDLSDPYLAVLNSNCEVLSINDDYYSLDSHLEFSVPEDGVFILAASSCCDWELIGDGYSRGSYQLVINTPPPAIGSITVRVTDALNGDALRGDSFPWASIELIRCEGDVCEQYLASENTNAFGEVRFEFDYRGSRLTVGEYMLRAYAQDYRETESPVFYVGEGEEYDLGDITLQPAPITFSDIQHCEELLPQGGVCRYSVQLNNNTNGSMRGRAWSIVHGYGLGSELGYTAFEATVPTGLKARKFIRRKEVLVDALDSRQLTFQFTVPSYIQSGASFCTQVYFGFHPDPMFNTAKEVHLFCLNKSSAGFRRLSAAEMKKVIQARPKK